MDRHTGTFGLLQGGLPIAGQIPWMTTMPPAAFTEPITLNFWQGWEDDEPTCRRSRQLHGPLRFGTRRQFASTPDEALSFEELAAGTGGGFKVYTNSMGDFWDARLEVEEARHVALNTMRQTPHLTWMVLTRHPERILSQLQAALQQATERYARTPTEPGRLFIQWLSSWLDGGAPENIWLGTTMEEPEGASRRVADLLNVPAAKRFLSCNLCCPRLLYGPEFGCGEAPNRHPSELPTAATH